MSLGSHTAARLLRAAAPALAARQALLQPPAMLAAGAAAASPFAYVTCRRKSCLAQVHQAAHTPVRRSFSGAAATAAAAAGGWRNGESSGSEGSSSSTSAHAQTSSAYRAAYIIAGGVVAAALALLQDPAHADFFSSLRGAGFIPTEHTKAAAAAAAAESPGSGSPAVDVEESAKQWSPVAGLAAGSAILTVAFNLLVDFFGREVAGFLCAVAGLWAVFSRPASGTFHDFYVREEARRAAESAARAVPIQAGADFAARIAGAIAAPLARISVDVEVYDLAWLKLAWVRPKLSSTRVDLYVGALGSWRRVHTWDEQLDPSRRHPSRADRAL
eukprot:tig00021590_g22769.t1